MLAASAPAGHSGRSLTTTYETIAYYIHRSSGRLWLNDVMRQQEGIHDDNQYVQLHRCDYQEGTSQEEVDYDHEEVFDEED
jgi:hypothetical protein